MTQAEWLTANDPTPMLEFLRGKASKRKRRLLACGCCRHLWRMLTDPRSQRAVEVAERLADNAAGEDEVRRAVDDAAAAILTIGVDVFQAFSLIG